MRPVGRIFLFVYSIRAFGRALAECMDWKCALFHAREAASATTGSTVVWRGNVQKAMLILAVTLAAFVYVGSVFDDMEIAGRVVRVADGDTITILDAANTQHKIRLYGIDAPESHQAFGQKSKQHLSSLVFGRDVIVKYKSCDKYGRILGTVFADGKDVNLEMLKVGLAWHYKHYDKNPEYAASEASARAARLGLWQDKNPVNPYDFRKSRREMKGK